MCIFISDTDGLVYGALYRAGFWGKMKGGRNHIVSTGEFMLIKGGTKIKHKIIFFLNYIFIISQLPSVGSLNILCLSPREGR